MHCEIIDCYFNIFFFVEIQLRKQNFKSFFGERGTRVWSPKLVYQTLKQPDYVPDCNEFDISEYQIKKTRKLKNSKAILADPEKRKKIY